MNFRLTKFCPLFFCIVLHLFQYSQVCRKCLFFHRTHPASVTQDVPVRFPKSLQLSYLLLALYAHMDTRSSFLYKYLHPKTRYYKMSILPVYIYSFLHLMGVSNLILHSFPIRVFYLGKNSQLELLHVFLLLHQDSH